MRTFRIGIDVGGTFTDAVLIDERNLEIVAAKKVHTTHAAAEGVARGIVEVLTQILAESGVDPEQVGFIAHGTTQATNALLEGDVARVGIVGVIPPGIEGYRARTETTLGHVRLGRDLLLHTYAAHLETEALTPETIEKTLVQLVERGAEVFVASASFGVDNPEPELAIADKAVSLGYMGCAGHELSKLYGLKVRTRTAAINASILPVMVRTADMTESSVRSAGLLVPFMVMRGDAGVMNIDEMRKRPLLTMLSGPAAGVAGALMYARLSDAIFLEVGGTSTDISTIKNGQVEIRYAEVGGHRTYMRSLDTRTVGLAGGSIVRARAKRVVDVGPRSAHIAGLRYPVYSSPEEIAECEVVFVSPKSGDPPEYVALQRNGKPEFALTLSDVANCLGLVRPEHYAYGNREAAEMAVRKVAESFGKEVRELAEEAMSVACSRVEPIVQDLIQEYQLEKSHLVLAGGGGGAAALVPYLAQSMDLEFVIVESAQIMSTIGVALAAVRDVVERTIFDPTPDDILRIRAEAEQAAIASGASPGTVSVKIEVDKQRNIVRAIATGATALQSKDIATKAASETELLSIAATSLGLDGELEKAQHVAQTDLLHVYQARKRDKGFLGLFRRTSTPARVVDHSGVIRLKLRDAHVRQVSVRELESALASLLRELTRYSEGGPLIPRAYLLLGGKILDLSSLTDAEQLVSLALTEARGYDRSGPVVVVMEER